GGGGAAVAVGVARGRVGYAGRAVRPGGLAGRRVDAGHARELIHAVVRRRLDLVPVVHAVVALELSVVRHRVGRGPPIVVRVEPLGVVVQREEEEVGVGAGGRTLTWAVHVGHAIGAEALRPIIPAAGLGRVDQREGHAAIWCRAFLVEVDGHAGHVRRPAGVDQQRGIIERPGRGVNHLAEDAAGLTGRVGLLPEFNEAVLAGEALPALGAEPKRRIDTAGGAAAPSRRKRRRGIGAVRGGAIERAWYPK